MAFRRELNARAQHSYKSHNDNILLQNYFIIFNRRTTSCRNFTKICNVQIHLQPNKTMIKYGRIVALKSQTTYA